MPFNTYSFIVFFLVVVSLHYCIKNWKIQKINLLAASYIFYAAWNPLFVFLLFGSTLCDWLVAKRMHSSNTQAKRKWYLLISLIFNLGLLSYFKYGLFLLENSILLLNIIGVDFNPATSDIILPIGISFYTFQTLSYSLDVYRKKIKPGKSFLDYALYVSFFPQLVAGPIVRAGDFLPQCEKAKRATQEQFGWGLSLITTGLFMKVILSDTILAPVVDKVYLAPGNFNAFETWAAVFSFSSQIYCDFAGYSICAIGIALCLGFILPENFNATLWSRWLQRFLEQMAYQSVQLAEGLPLHQPWRKSPLSRKDHD